MSAHKVDPVPTKKIFLLRLLSGCALLLVAAFFAACDKPEPNVPPPETPEVEDPEPVSRPGIDPVEDVDPGPVDEPAPTPMVPAPEPEPEEDPLPTRPIDTFVLDKLLPVNVQGFTFVRANSNTNIRPSVRVQTTFAERTFIGNDNNYLIFKIRDGHERPALVEMANNLVFKRQPNNRNENETENVFMWGDFPAYEKETRGDLTYSRIQVMIEERVLVELYGTRMSLEDLWAYMASYDIPRIQEFVMAEMYTHQQEALKEREALQGGG